jgi:hypothetical protein
MESRATSLFSCLSTRWCSLLLSVLLLSLQFLSSTLEGPASPFLLSGGLQHRQQSSVSSAGAAAGSAAAPRAFSLSLDASNTAYQMVMVGPYDRQLMAAIAALQLRRVDAERDILLHITRPLEEGLMEVFEQLRVRVLQVPHAQMIRAEFDYGQCCSMFWACWLKILTWNQTQYRAVLNLDTDFLAAKSLAGAFDIMAANAQSPFDVGGVADPVVGASHKEAALFDVFNGGMFLALPSKEAFETFLVHAHTSRWQWGEMLWLNTFATTYGHWVRLPITFNIFPNMLRAGSPFLPYGDVNWDSIYGLHFAGISKVTAATTASDCHGRAASDCVPCCLAWVAAGERMAAMLAANKRVREAGGLDAGGEALGVLAALLPSGWAPSALATVVRNTARGYTFDYDAYHDGGAGGTWRERKALEAAYVAWMAAGNSGGPEVFEAQYAETLKQQKAGGK